MNPLVVVLPDSLIYLINQLAQCFELCGSSQINFEFVIEWFLIAVLPRAAGSGTGNRYSDSFQSFDENSQIVFAAIVGVEYLWPWVVMDSVEICQQRPVATAGRSLVSISQFQKESVGLWLS